MGSIIAVQKNDEVWSLIFDGGHACPVPVNTENTPEILETFRHSVEGESRWDELSRREIRSYLMAYAGSIPFEVGIEVDVDVCRVRP